MAASRKALLITAAMAVVVVVGALLPATASATEYRVGDDSGWALGVDYEAWSRSKGFKVGDRLEFVYSTEEEPAHSVVQVDVANFEACTVPSDAVTLTSGDDHVQFGEPGPHLFICGVEEHCKSGMKLRLVVNFFQ